MNGLVSMAAIGGAIGKVVGIMYGGRRRGSGQDKAVININGGMLFKPIVRDIIFDSPV